MKASLHSGSVRHSLRWAVLAALLLLSFGAPARGGHDGGGHGGWSHAAAGHDGDWHGGARHGGGRHHGRFHRGDRAFFALGFWPFLYEPYAYGYPLSDGYYTSPPVYVEQGDEAQSAYWYYCAASRGYYPYVTQCPGGWLRVVPGPANQ